MAQADTRRFPLEANEIVPGAPPRPLSHFLSVSRPALSSTRSLDLEYAPRGRHHPTLVEYMIDGVREITGHLGFFRHVERVVDEWEGARDRRAGIREYFAGLAAADA